MIITRAYIREVGYTSVAVTIVIVTIVAVIRLVKLLSDASKGEVPVDGILVLLGLKLASFVDLIVPLVVYVSILLVTGRWIRDSELVVLHACGISLTRVLRSSIALIIIVGVVVASFSLYFTPAAIRLSAQTTEEHKQRAEVASVTPGVFNESRAGGVYYVEELGDRPESLTNVFIYRRSGVDDSKRDAVIVAESGFQYVDERSSDRFLVLEKGTRYEGRPGEFEWTVMNFEKYALRIKEQPPVRVTLAAKARPTAELLGHGGRRERAELHWRISKPLVVPILVLLALSFCYVTTRRSQLPRMMAALGLYFVYNNMLGYGHALLRKGKIDPELGLWSVHALFALLAIYLFWRRVRNRPVLPRPFRRRAAA